MGILENIHGHDDLLRINDEEKRQLCKEIREFLISHISRTGGHLAGHLGVVELSVAIETGSLLWNYEAETGLLWMWAGLSCFLSRGNGYVERSEEHTSELQSR